MPEKNSWRHRDYSPAQDRPNMRRKPRASGGRADRAEILRTAHRPETARIMPGFSLTANFRDR
jgi:hypothetical protein